MIEKAYLINEYSDLSASYAEYGRFYVGDQHCEHNCAAILKNARLAEFLKAMKKPVTVLTPQVSDIGFEPFLSLVVEFAGRFPAPEIVVSDYGMLKRLSECGIPIVLGNSLVGQSKDPMLRDFSAKATHVRLGIDLPYYGEFLARHDVKAFELFNTFQGWTVSNLSLAGIHLHYPFVSYSQTRYCRAALRHQGKDYLEVVTECPGCFAVGAPKLSLSLAEKSPLGKIDNIYVGNRQFYRNDELPSTGYSRIVYNYDVALA